MATDSYLIEEWEAESVDDSDSDKLSQSTFDRYSRHVENWADWLSDNRDKSPWEADNLDLRRFIKQLDRNDMAPSTISQRVSAISKFYQAMGTIAEEKEEEGEEVPDIPDNPYDNLKKKYKKRLRGDTKKKQAMSDSTDDEFAYLDRSEVNKLKKNVPKPKRRNELIIMLLFNCGFRREELAQCKIRNPRHIDRDDESIYIPPMKSPEGRTVAYNPDYLGFHLDRWLNHERDNMTYANESDYLFPTNDSKHISGDYINQMIKQAADNAGLQEITAEYSDGRKQHKITAHTLRHSFAMQLVEEVDIRKLQKLLGHEELETTLIYLHMSEDEAKEASRGFDPSPDET
ncbi:tyrosine-type recombinase/integrase [Halorientalis marina]|uniref:tyrosine-type recombinase/integrase n=1 Tax=Halorientalis marina TaxID=2931976 RepID=UPI001FF640A7|nr:tyrosine-type recombinase/integrase [Halorientalis marina]